jgi:hypothetical protein
MRCQAFAASYWNLVFRAELRQTVLASVADFLRKDGSSPQVAVLDSLEQLIVKIASEFEKPAMRESGYAVLEMMTGILDQGAQFAAALHRAMIAISDKIDDLPATEELGAFVTSLLSTLVFHAGDRQMFPAEGSAAILVIRRVWGDDPPRPVYLQLLQWAAGTPEVSVEEPFEIRQPRALLVILNVFKGSGLLTEALTFLRRLSRHSASNCERMHEGEIDLGVLEFLRRARTDSAILATVVDTVLDIFGRIAEVASSVSVIQTFISFLCPIDGHFLPRSHLATIKKLSQLICHDWKRRAAAVPYLPDNTYDVHHVEVDQIAEGFSLLFQIDVSTLSPDYHPVLFQLNCTGGTDLVLGASMDSVTLSVTSAGSTPSRAAVRIPFQAEKTSFLGCSFRKIDEKGPWKVIFALDEAVIDAEASVAALRLSGRAITCSVGGATADSSIPGVPWAFGCVALFSHHPNLIDLCSQEALAEKVSDSSFFFIPSRSGQHLVLRNVARKSQVFSPTRVLSKSNATFGDLLLHRCGVDLLLPLFSQWSLTYEDGSLCPELPEATMSLFSSALIKSKEAQEIFAKSNGFVMLAYLLQERAPAFLNFATYSSFERLFHQIAHKTLKEHLFQAILTNLVLWQQAAPDVREQILRHWHGSLFPRYAETAAKLRDFTWFLNAMTFYDSDASEQLVTSYHSIFAELAIFVAQSDFTDSDLRNLIALIMGSESLQNVFLTILARLLGHPRKPGSNATNSLRYLRLLRFLQSVDDEALALFSLRVLLMAAFSGLLDPVRPENVIDIVIRELPPCRVAKSYFQQLLPLLPKAPSLYPICAWLAANLGPAAIQDLYAGIEPEPRYLAKTACITWGVLSLFRATPDLQPAVASFLARSLPSDPGRLLVMVDLVGRALELPVDDIAGLLLVEFADRLATIESSKDFFRLARHFLFFHWDRRRLNFPEFDGPVPDDSPRAERRVRSSGIKSVQSSQAMAALKSQAAGRSARYAPARRSSSAATQIVDATSDDIVTPSRIDEGLDAIGPQFARRFGLRLDADGDWTDLPLTRAILCVFGRFPAPEAIDTVFAVCGFLVRFDSVAADLAISQLGKDTSADGIAFFNRAKSPDNDPTAAFGFLQRFAESEPTDFETDVAHAQARWNASRTRSAALATETFEMVAEMRSIATDLRPDFANELAREYANAQALWNRFFRYVTIERGPWEESLPAARKAHFKRDRTLCANLVAPKLKRNLHFTNHAAASRERDSGHSTPEEKVEQTRERLERRYTDAERTFFFELEGTEAAHDTKCVVELECEIVSVNGIRPATFTLMKDVLILSKSRHRAKFIPLNQITEILLRPHLHHLSAIEIFYAGGFSRLINFPTVSALSVLNSFQSLPWTIPPSIQTLPFRQDFANRKLTERWQARSISNFAYLMYLNRFSGRTMNDPSQYPIFPWVVSEYGRTLDLSDAGTYRDLTTPIGALGAERLANLQESYRGLKEMGMEPYLFGSGYSASLHVGLWLLRLEPFTTLHIEIQDGHFDYATRLFQSVPDAYRLSSSTVNDYRELIPEFYSSAEFLVNSNHFDLGTGEDGVVDDVVLPQWGNASPMAFIYAHRKALESDHVSAHLHDWIDLIWGYKQKGDEALKAKNVFMRALYEDVWDNVDSTDAGPRAAAEAMLCHVGQIPAQLFTKGHPVRGPKSEPYVPAAARQAVQRDDREIAIARVVRGKGHVKVNCLERNLAVTNRTIDLAELLRPVDSRTSDARIAKPVPPAAAKRRANTVHGMPRSNLAGVAASLSGHLGRDSNKWHRRVGFVHGRFLIAESNSDKVVAARPGSDGRELIVKHRARIMCVACHKDWIAIGDDESMLSVYYQAQLKFDIPIFTSCVQCCAISVRFQLIVCGNGDGSLLFCSLNRGFVTRVVPMPDAEPILVLVTKGWGFVCVYFRKLTGGVAKHFLALFTVNGELIRQVEIPSAVSAWHTFADQNGFDFLAIAARDLTCYVFEAFYLNLGQEFCIAKGVVVGISYIKDPSVLVTVGASGSITFHPLQL